jgi:prevent-host-death family protein
MKQVNIYEAKSNLSRLLAEVQAGEEIVIAKAGKPIADLKPHKPDANRLVFGALADSIEFDDEDFEPPDPEILTMFYGSAAAPDGPAR